MVLVFCLLIIGFLGCFIPILPGPPIAYFGLFLAHSLTNISFELDLLLLLAGLVLIVTFLDYWLQIYGVRKFGGGRKATNGVIIGLVVGFFLIPPFGIILGPFIGAYIGAKMEQRDNISNSLKVALGALFGFLGGAFLKIVLVLYMVLLFLNQFFIS